MKRAFIGLLMVLILVPALTIAQGVQTGTLTGTLMFATNLGSWVIPGAICAGLYLIMSLPLAALARALERRWRMA